jgi:hypothetical protein
MPLEIRGLQPNRVTRSLPYRRPQIEQTDSVPLQHRSQSQPPPRLPDQFHINTSGKQQAYPARYIGSLVVVWRREMEQFRLLTCPEGEPLSSNCFSTFEHCHSAAVELEQTFAMEDAFGFAVPPGIALRSSETWEAIAEVIRQHLQREQVELRLAAK